MEDYFFQESCPNFLNLLNDLQNNHLAIDFSSKELYEEKEKLVSILHKERQQELERKLIHNELSELILENKSNIKGKAFQNIINNNIDSTTLGKEDKIYDVLNHLMAIGEVCRIFQSQDGKEEIGPLGFSKEEFRNSQMDSNLKDQQIELLRQAIFPQLEDRLFKKLESIYSFYEQSQGLSSKQTIGEAFIRAKILKLNERVLDNQIKLKKDDEILKIGRRSIQIGFWEYYKVLNKSLNILGEILTEYKLKSQLLSDETLEEWLKAKFDTICLKLEVLKQELLTDTYKPDSILGLEKIRGYLEEAHVNCFEDLQRISKKLSAYESIGMGFNKLALEYASILKDIERNQWTLDQVQS